MKGVTAPTTGSKNLALAAMVFAVAMMFIDQTIVSIAVPNIQNELSLSGSGSFLQGRDLKPGDINGQDTFDIALSDNRHTVLDIGTPYDGPSALYWTIAIP